ncbi:hypothetical protein CYY_009165 [Polysphondylium violaceum]|uniref:Carrier domain-containing protein n=1 Tax=Polysphondylium violaceum TaxID=133409 RepID=A0A8J4PM70_9MYCE|nr:hypothetical protein CYY_009165 [Polysphondylium violaceum]
MIDNNNNSKNKENEKRVKKIIAKQLGTKPDKINNDDRILNVEGIHFMGKMHDLFIAIGREFDIEIPNEEAKKIKTVNQLLSYIAIHQYE